MSSLATKTGRWSSKEPQTANTPKSGELCKLVNAYNLEDIVIVSKFILEEHRHLDRRKNNLYD